MTSAALALADAPALPASCAAGIRVHREQLEPGDAGIRRTVQVMRELVRENRALPFVRSHAEAIVAGVGAGDSLGELRAVFDWITARVDYRQDPNGTDWLQAPWLVLCQLDEGIRPQLDCDDLTDLALALLESVGHATGFHVVSQRPDQQFNHVYGLDYIGDVAVRVDLVEAFRPPGATPPPETRTMTVDVNGAGGPAMPLFWWN